MVALIGQKLGNYHLTRLLGRGGFSEVYLGEHLYLKNQAAIKVLRTSLSDEEIDQFLSEARTLARLSHPQIVRVIDFAVEHGTPFLVMEYAQRGTLRTLYPPGSFLSLETTVAYVKQIAAALQYAHNHQVIHRDVKPENMLLNSQQQVMLSDFGIALFTPSPQQLSTQEMAGTIPYMSPEQIHGRPSFASDQYSLGIIAYEWLCGVRPFEGAPWQIAYQQVSVPPPRLRDHDPSLPEAVEAVVLKALAKDPRERFVSVQLFAQALERASHVNGMDHIDMQITTPIVAIPSTRAFVSRRVFFSASPKDETFVTHLAADLQRRGVAVWQKESTSTSNPSDRADAVRQAIRAADVMVLVVSPYTRSSRTTREHLRIASMYQRRLVFVWTTGEDVNQVLPDEWGKSAQVDLIDARQMHNEQVIDELVAFLGETPSVVETPLPEPAFEPRNPYKGLRAFTQADTADFFGRDTLIEAFTDSIKNMLTQGGPGCPPGRLLAVIGASGSGKSSVVMAGLLPRLMQGALPASQEWIYLEPVMPGTRPLEALTLTLAPHFPGRSVKSIREDLEDESARGLHLLATRLATRRDRRVVLFIDQFEEVFTLTTSEEERRHFIDLVVTAATEPHGSVLVLITLRADFFDRPMDYPTLYRLIEAHRQSVLPMELADLRAVIKQPAALPTVQLTFEGNLVGDLLFEVQSQAGALPLLQFTLDQLFQHRNGHMLTLQAYRQIGGVKGALAKHAEATFTSLPTQEHQRLAQALFMRLIDPGTTEQDMTRRRAARSEMQKPDPRQTLMLEEVVTAFTAARLLTTNTVAGTATIEVSHEALIREWRRLYEWMREAREDIPLQHAISEDAAAWERRNRPVDRLYRGTQLDEALAWRERNLPSIDEEAFLAASIAESERQRVQEQERIKQERQQRTRSTRRTILVGVAGVLLAVMILLGTYLFQKLQGPPAIAGAYQGQIINTFANKHTPMTLTIQQDRTSIHGYFTVAKPLSGNGPLTGSVDAKGKIMFLVRSKDRDATNPILFTGAIQPDKSLAGSYCSVKLKNQTQCEPTMGHGIWNVTRTTSGLITTSAFLGSLLSWSLFLFIDCGERRQKKHPKPPLHLARNFCSNQLCFTSYV
jgi:serine/threonine protein kinase